MKLNIKNANIISLSITSIVYIFLLIIVFNNCYFWDTIQQVSKEAHWFYLNNFDSLLITGNESLDIFATGYHPPLMGIMTAFLWKIFGYNLCVSHIFSLFWGILLIYNLCKLLYNFFEKKHIGLIVLILMLESTVLTQFAISSPDFIMLTAFVISVRAILENKSWILSIALIFLCCLNMRGVFLGAILFVANAYYTYLTSHKKYGLKLFIKNIVPYLPTLTLLAAYYIYYFISKGWFFNDSPYTSHYIMPESFMFIIKHFASLLIRLVENGRFVIWIIFGLLFIKILKSKINLSNSEKFLLTIAILILVLYLILIFITQMPFSSRYFMPLFLIISILCLSWGIKAYNSKKMKIIFVLIILFQLSGNLWVYPEKIAVSWDGTLAHLPYYELRKECFEYLDSNNISYEKTSAGNMISGNRLYIELKDIGTLPKFDLEKEYIIYSNISNLDDEYIDILHDESKWKKIKTLRKWPVFISIYQKEI